MQKWYIIIAAIFMYISMSNAGPAQKQEETAQKA